MVADPLVDPNSWASVTIDAFAWAVFFAGAGLRFWATLYVGGRKNEQVVSGGPYSLCRHPLYVGTILLVLSGALFLKSLLFALGMALLTTAYVRLTVPAEEEYLTGRLGDPYRAYCQRVNRLWPSMRHFHTDAKITADVHSLYMESARASRWIWLPVVGQVLSRLRMAPWWPRLFHIP